MADGDDTFPHVTLRTPVTTATLRRATPRDVRAIVTLLADDQLGGARDSTEDLRPYLLAFQAIDQDPAHLLLVAETDGEVIATMQVSFLPGLSRRGALRAEIEGVRVDAPRRRTGLGRVMITWAIEEAGRRGCALVQLTTDKRRIDAHRFYARLGFANSHEGFKLALEPNARPRAD
jgi:GNAT superfamily N-acetyltransferase